MRNQLVYEASEEAEKRHLHAQPTFVVEMAAAFAQVFLDEGDEVTSEKVMALGWRMAEEWEASYSRT